MDVSCLRIKTYLSLFHPCFAAVLRNGVCGCRWCHGRHEDHWEPTVRQQVLILRSRRGGWRYSIQLFILTIVCDCIAYMWVTNKSTFMNKHCNVFCQIWQLIISIWNTLFMAPRIKLIVLFNLLWSEFDETNATFRSASTDLDHALVVCDLTQIPIA